MIRQTFFQPVRVIFKWLKDGVFSYNRFPQLIQQVSVRIDTKNCNGNVTEKPSVSVASIGKRDNEHI